MTGHDFESIAAPAIAALCAQHPAQATMLGNHEHDGQLGDPSPAAAERRRRQLRSLIGQLDALDRTALDTASGIDAEILRTEAQSELLLLTELDEPSWNPMLHNPGQAIYSLLSRDFAPAADRLADVVARAAALPDYLAAARQRLTDCSAVHIETTIGQLDGSTELLRSEVPRAFAAAGLPQTAEPELTAATTAVAQHQDWLRAQLPNARRSPRLGQELFARKLALTLATPWQPAALLEQAYADLARIEDELAELVARRSPGGAGSAEAIAAEFARLGQDMPTSSNILQHCRDALAEATEFVTEHDLLTLLHDPVEIIEMPEIDRGVAVAYCEGVGALETAELLTQFAVSPTPADWSPERMRSFYREYNIHMLHNLTVHEGMPGHVEQLSHARRYRGDTQVRAVFGSGSFIEGWAVYAESLMAEHGYRSKVSVDAAHAVRMQQLKMQLRMVLNTILDITFHTGELDEAAAMALMTGRGYQEDGEAAGKWRRVQLTSTQLSTYYVGYLEVKQLIADLRVAKPAWSLRQAHDAVLSFGSPPVRQLRSLLGLAPAG